MIVHYISEDIIGEIQDDGYMYTIVWNSLVVLFALIGFVLCLPKMSTDRVFLKQYPIA